MYIILSLVINLSFDCEPKDAICIVIIYTGSLLGIYYFEVVMGDSYIMVRILKWSNSVYIILGPL